MMRTLFVVLLFFGISGWSQTANPKELSYNEFLGYVKKYHPLVKSADLQISAAQANLMMARGSFDPKVEVDFEQKKFKDQEYYSLLNSSFKIPTWYGIEVKAGFDNNDGIYLNPENTVPESRAHFLRHFNSHWDRDYSLISAWQIYEKQKFK